MGNYIPVLWKTCTPMFILENFDSKVPENRSKLESLPGVGRKTANVILNTYFGCRMNQP